jgi:hypothetical protein
MAQLLNAMGKIEMGLAVYLELLVILADVLKADAAIVLNGGVQAGTDA